jgi:hypothetical protein
MMQITVLWHLCERVRSVEVSHRKRFFVCNFTPMEWDQYAIPMSGKAKLTKILDSSELDFGGEGDVSEISYVQSVYV